MWGYRNLVYGWWECLDGWSYFGTLVGWFLYDGGV